MSRIPILMYHHVAPEDFPSYRKYVVRPEAFRRQMMVLARLGYEAISMDHLVAIEAGGDGPPRPVAITFDDGYAGLMQHAVPVLESHGFTATFFVVTDLVGKSSAWLRAERGLDLPLFGWTDAEKLVTSGFAVESHSATHPRLALEDDSRCRYELERSRVMISDRLGRPSTHLAYPYGSVDERVRDLAREAGYASACGVRIGLSSSGEDPLLLPRLPVEGDLGLAAFIARLKFGSRPREMVGAIRARTRADRHVKA